MCVLVLGCGLAGSALAAMDPAGSPSDRNAQAAARISERLRADLARAGFTDVTIMPSSFLVRAKDSQGNPVMMVIKGFPDRSDASLARDRAQGCAARRGDQGRTEQPDPLARSEAVAWGARAAFCQSRP